MRTRRDIRVKVNGVVYTGTYEVDDGDIYLMSAYGSGRAKVGEDVKASAETLLEKAVEKWRP